ncbi:hypothetical protein EJB05_16840, partial [Eragrostis curvula]
MAAGLLEDETRGSEEGSFPWGGCIGITLSVGIFPAFALLICVLLYFNVEDPKFWVKLSGVQGLERSADAVTAPTFNITVRVDNQNNHHREFCGKGGGVDVSYAGVPLAHGEFTEFCVPPGVVGSVPVVATSEGLGLPDELYESMEIQRQRHERVPLAVHVRMRGMTGTGRSPILVWCTAVLHGQPAGPFVCPLLYMSADGIGASPIAVFLACLLLMVWGCFYDFAPPEFWVKIQGVEGLDRSTDAATAPAFNVILRVNYDLSVGHNWPQLCGKGGSVVVSYAGVPLAHGDLPEFCVPVGVAGSVRVVATSDGLGVPDELYERMESQRQRHGRVPLTVHVQIDELTGSSGSPTLLWCTAILHGQPKGPFICSILK